jgi:hypothetical protein
MFLKSIRAHQIGNPWSGNPFAPLLGSELTAAGFHAMKSSLQHRLQKLEAQRAAKTRIDRVGVLFELPDDHIGEKHVVIESRMATDRPEYEWCMFEEVPGPGRDESEGATVVARISYAERDL